MAKMTEVDLMKQSVQQGRVERTTRLIEQCVNASALREFHSWLTSDQEAVKHPANEEFIGNLQDRIKVLES